MEVQTQTITTYVANDGTRFNSAEECQTYERTLLPAWKQIALEEELVSYCPDYNELTSCYREDIDITKELSSYTKAIIKQACDMDNKGLSFSEICAKLGLN
jgi:hypothetical protein